MIILTAFVVDNFLSSRQCRRLTARNQEALSRAFMRIQCPIETAFTFILLIGYTPNRYFD